MRIILILILIIAVGLVDTKAVETMVLPPRLRAGDVVGIVSPAGCISNAAELRASLESSMASLGLRTFFQQSWDDCDGYLAGTDEQRALAVNQMFRNESIAAVLASRGGWGCARIVQMFDYDAMRANAKIFMGYSDLTACLNAVTRRTGVVTFHGPLGSSNWSDESGANVVWSQRLLVDAQPALLSNSDAPDAPTPATIRAGKAKGRLIGGNLSVFDGILGSDYAPALDDFDGAILFLEDVNEASYRIDRMLTQLQLFGALERIAGFVWGTCSGCSDGGFSVAQVLDQHIAPLNIPAFSGAQFGHIAEQFIMPIGARVEIDASNHTIQLLHSVVQ
jgi:muramoyltetrapeptide carboxypeptidase